MSVPSFTIPRVDISTKKPRKGLARYVRHEFQDGNPLWVYSQTTGSATASPVNMIKPVPRFLAPISRIVRAVSSFLF